jgi:hypothetical protein
MPHPRAKVHRMFELVEPIATVTFSEVPNEAFLALGMRNYWDGYFAGRAAPLGLAPAEVVHAVFYNFADGEVARHIPWVWGKITPQEAIAVRERGSAAALRQMIGELADEAQVEWASQLTEGNVPLIDELALEFDDGFRHLPIFVERGWLNDAALPTLAQLDEQLDAMSGQHNAHLWHAEALKDRAEWKRVRALARAALTLLG